MAVTRRFITTDGESTCQPTPDAMNEFAHKLVNSLISIAYEELLKEEAEEAEP